jgi:hypothetical protein
MKKMQATTASLGFFSESKQETEKARLMQISLIDFERH